MKTLDRESYLVPPCAEVSAPAMIAATVASGVATVSALAAPVGVKAGATQQEQQLTQTHTHAPRKFCAAPQLFIFKLNSNEKENGKLRWCKLKIRY